jgi:hypothetical protein
MNEDPLKLHPSFASWIDSESSRIAGSLQDLTHRAPKGSGLPKDSNLPVVAEIGPDDIIGELLVIEKDLAGTMVAWLYPQGDKWIGLADERMIDARRVAERIWRRREINERLSLETIEESLFEWLRAANEGRSTDALSGRIEQKINENVRPLFVVIPVDELYIDEEFSFATATIIPLSRATLDDIVSVAGPKYSKERVQALQADLHRTWLGKAGMRFELLAEPRRAQEIAFERASDYMTLLQFYGAPAIVLALTSHAAPTGTRPYRTLRCLSYGPDNLQRTKRVAESTYQLTMTSVERVQAERNGLLILSSLAQDTPCEYEEKLLEALLVYGRACYQLDPTDKLLQVMTAVEMFALRDASESIQAGIADRLAFAITADPNSREGIADNFRKVYNLRSRRAHHGKSISETETIEKFLCNAWTFFLTAIRGVGHYRTRTKFLDHLDRVKYGHE